MALDKIVIVDDDPYMRDGLSEVLQAKDRVLHVFDNAHDGLNAVADGTASLLLTDITMPGMDGLELLQQTKRLDSKLPVVMITANVTVETAVKAMSMGAFDYIMKPIDAEQLEHTVRRALTHRHLLTENELLRDALSSRFTLTDFVGDSPAMRMVFEQIRQVAPTDATVFVHGESGTGKELVARAIHIQSNRRNKPLISVNCAALSAGVLESELFGHERGAFTGADKQRKGRFELAEGGTLFLDEVSEMDLNLQGKLLRVIQEREFERVGSSETIKADVRIIASSNRNMQKSITDKVFREDLYYRLNVFELNLPSLRERQGDIRRLVSFLIKKHNGRIGVNVQGFDEAALSLLEQHPWPGNVRELENVVERALILSSGKPVLGVDCLYGFPPTTRQVTTINNEPLAEISPAVYVPRTIEDVEREHIMQTLEYCNDHRTKSAQILGISERTLRDRIQKWTENGLWPKKKSKRGD